MIDELRPPLRRGLETLGLDAALTEPLLAYLVLLHKWNRAYNLSAVREPAQMVPRHLLDSLATLPHVRGPRVLDLGTGPGLPGIPLALARPDWQLVLLDSNGKKIRFVRQAVLELGIGNVEAVQARVQDYRPRERFDSVICRAFTELADFAALAEPLRAPHGRLLAMKGPLAETEQQALEPERYQVHDHRLVVPGLQAERRLLVLRPTEE
ncbi:16S rRNA (guanine(527)-N(7))-methyltransferase RsmG [Alkalilimnicola sp. S0819]|uniref:16S rRNA (guanine(527)-N(7))-methyltransferase RsmG n=1 Tax=Alkalilimnicola sp. S0819 TaxID=2613922 RepID=UPI001261B7C4|nr:16S rRNA (guanine(527)-N(7))-methyltransferase RsmG [Alkalilimnicola sp. S0819]KAB7624224.1 16S rRNA (guanine(527)-N(7))-methyltransferase RsmG [Alkalilimnicola sp. S0819]MPQ16479.1 16S rRNA (guanine(527)-N(7))-methyltransferase RsmG [Alkalilimnicola sp. S0819]